MAYSKDYQTVRSGRVREDERAFNKLNKVATPAGIFSIANTSAKKQPKIDKNFMTEHERVGTNQRRTIPVVSAYNSVSTANGR